MKQREATAEVLPQPLHKTRDLTRGRPRPLNDPDVRHLGESRPLHELPRLAGGNGTPDPRAGPVAEGGLSPSSSYGCVAGQVGLLAPGAWMGSRSLAPC